MTAAFKTTGERVAALRAYVATSRPAPALMRPVGNGDGYGNGYGDGYGNGNGNGDGYGNGNGDGYGYGNGDGYGNGYGTCSPHRGRRTQ